MKYAESEEKIYTTTDYEGFVFTDWNRDVSNARTVKMVEAIESTGWLPEPVLVNEKFEVIDGQSRVKALERLNMPVEFCIKPGIGRKECQILNLFQKNWNTMDYINSYIADKNQDYIWLKQMIIKYAALSSGVVLAGCVSKGACVHNNGIISEVVSEGKFRIKEREKWHVEGLLFFLSRFVDTIKYLGGRKDTFFTALAFIYNLKEIDNDRVTKVINDAKYDSLVNSATTEGWLTQIEELYNKNLIKTKKVDIIHEYKIA